MKCLAQGHNTASQVRIESVTLRSRVGPTLPEPRSTATIGSCETLLPYVIIIIMTLFKEEALLLVEKGDMNGQ